MNYDELKLRRAIGIGTIVGVPIVIILASLLYALLS